MYKSDLGIIHPKQFRGTTYEVVEHDGGGEDGDEADGDAEDVNAAEPVANVCREKLFIT